MTYLEDLLRITRCMDLEDGSEDRIRAGLSVIAYEPSAELPADLEPIDYAFLDRLRRLASLV